MIRSSSTLQAYLLVPRSHLEHPVHVLPGFVVPSTQPQIHTSVVQRLQSAYPGEHMRSLKPYIHVSLSPVPSLRAGNEASVLFKGECSSPSPFRDKLGVPKMYSPL